MKIAHPKPVSAGDANLAARNRVPDPKQAAVGTQEKVSVSAEARDRMRIDLDRVRQTVAQSPDVREDKVAAVRQAVEQGTYHPPADAVAEKMILASLRDAVPRK